jgi:hypothetical protein
MKPVEDIVCCIWDYGTFISMAEMMGRVCKKAYYYSPFEEEFRDVKKCCIGTGLEFVERLNDPLDPERIEEIDLHIFPDIGFRSEQKLLRSMGRAVWGSNGADGLELSRTDFLDEIKSLGLPVVPYVPIVGLDNLAKHLEKVENKWVKINRFRANMETWKHIDYEHSRRKLEAMEVDFGGVQNDIEFIVQDEIDSQVEIGYDGWCVDGGFPSSSFQGYEQKNKLYLGSLLEYDKLPEAVREINEAISGLLKKFQYRNHIATEIRIADGVPYFIDPTMRLPGQTGEHLFTTCTNMPDVIWNGANGILIEPEWAAKFALEATLHYKGDIDAWKVISVPEEIESMVKLYHYCKRDGLYHFPTRKTDEVGVICGIGDTIEDAFENLKENFEIIKNEPVEIDAEEFVHLIKEVHEAEAEGVEFTSQEVPDPSAVIF